MTLIDRECWERGCACYDDRVDKDGVEVELKQPEQEPVAWMHCLPDGHNVVSTSDESAFIDGFTGTYSIIPLYTASPSIEAAVLAEREACAKLCDELDKHSDHLHPNDCAEAMRARSEK